MHPKWESYESREYEQWIRKQCCMKLIQAIKKRNMNNLKKSVFACTAETQSL